jgi:hypothetical protein
MANLSALILFILLNSAAFGLTVDDLRSGDVLLESLPCHLCGLIEIEEGAPFSHAGVILKENGQIRVLQALNRVQSVSIDAFLAQRRKGSPIEALRPLHRDRLDPRELSNRFHQQFEGLSYDSAFLWNNRDSEGEQLYCSEFVAKFLAPFLSESISTKPMHFNEYRDEWIRYFKGNPPDGLPGVSPVDLLRSSSFRGLGQL